MVDMKRRNFITLLGGAVAAWPLTARAQGAKRPTIGLLGGATASAQTQWTAAFVQRLRELGWVEGKTVAIEYSWVEGRFERSPAIIAEFARLKVERTGDGLNLAQVLHGGGVATVGHDRQPA